MIFIFLFFGGGHKIIISFNKQINSLHNIGHNEIEVVYTQFLSVDSMN